MITIPGNQDEVISRIQSKQSVIDPSQAAGAD